MRKSALQLVERQGFGGNSHDSISHAKLFRDDKPYDFGVMTSRLFASEIGSHLINKKFVYKTQAQGNFYEIPGGIDEYTWGVVGDGQLDIVIVELLTSGTQLGRNGQQFEVVVDKNWYGSPVLLLTENPDAPLARIIGQPRPFSAGTGYVLTLQVQSGNPNDFFASELFQPGRTLLRASTSVADEENQKYGGDQYETNTTLRSQVGQVANKIDFTDKFIRREIACMKSNTRNTDSYEFRGKSYTQAFASHYIYQADLMGKDGTKIQKGIFIPTAEARLLERTEMDMEMIMEFGRNEITFDQDSNRTIKTAPGWREIVKDGQYMQHTGNLTLARLNEYLQTIFFRRKGFGDRKIEIHTGTGGINFLNALIKKEASTAQYLEPGVFVHTNPSNQGQFHDKSLSYGAQFTEIMLPMGVTVTIAYDPMKDNEQLYGKQLAPGSQLPLESFNMDIFDFGGTENAPQGAPRSNMTMVKQQGVDEYYVTASIYDLYKGAPTSGEVRTDARTTSIRRTMAGSLAVWDVSRVGRIQWVM